MKRPVTYCIVTIVAFVAEIIISAGLCNAGMVSITFDDGLASVYTYAFPILLKHKQVATVGIVYSGVISGQPEFMTTGQVMELQKHGWEIASHGLTHANPKKIPRLYDQEYITGWTLKNEKLRIYQAPYAYRAVACLLEQGTIMKAVDSLDKITASPGSYYFDPQASKLYIYPFEVVDPAHMDIRSISTQRGIEYSKKELAKLGFNLRTYITPYDYWNDEIKKLSMNSYDYVATGKSKPNSKDSFDPYRITRYVVRSQDTVLSLRKLVMENAVSKDDWMIFCLHGIGQGNGWQPWTAEKLEEFSTWLYLMRIKVVTISEGAALLKSAQSTPLPANTN